MDELKEIHKIGLKVVPHERRYAAKAKPHTRELHAIVVRFLIARIQDINRPTKDLCP